ncbi:hypothetical protein EDD18DRAFT_1207658 [Armillaria luteobubalina]|uniref:Cyclase n=1 Tax=Armillaria luteobubalina TaxID=153913 RepID=A0AA39UHH1_9AGAR|nr:hypothetical protein EDD18DRAFT_1207658 [Armillaria luteobubalina]
MDVLCALFTVILLLPWSIATPIPSAQYLVAREYNSSDLYANWPTYQDLPLHSSFPTKAAWGVWGPEDEFGALNHITPATIQAAKSEIREGIAISLNLELNLPNPPLIKTRQGLTHAIIPFPGYQDDVLTLNTQISTQFDGLVHYPYSTNGDVSTYQFYNNLISFGDIMSPTKVTTLGMQNSAQKGIAGRAILLDWAGWMDSQNLTFSAFSEQGITATELDAVATWEGLPPDFTKPGDFLIVRTAMTKQYKELSLHDQEGVEASDEILEWMWNKKLSMVGSDNIAFEAGALTATINGTIDGTPGRNLHQVFIGGWGQSIVELLDLEELAETCHRLKRFSFFFTIQNLNVPGGIASPPNALAIL